MYPLEAEGGQVTYTVTGTFPKKTFIKKVVCVATPELRWEGGSVKGEPVTLQGEKIQANNQVIAWKEGGSFTYNGTFQYQPEMIPLKSASRKNTIMASSSMSRCSIVGPNT